MKSILAFFVLVSPWMTFAADGFRAVEFFEVIDPGNSRNPNWPGRVTLRDQPSNDVEQFKQLLQKSRWRIVYQCSGMPVPSSPNFYDGIHDSYRVQEFEAKRFRNYLLQKGSETARLTSTYSYRADAEGAGKFRLTYDEYGHYLALGPVTHIEETNEEVIHGTGPEIKEKCPDGSTVEVLLVPDVTPVS